MMKSRKRGPKRGCTLRSIALGGALLPAIVAVAQPPCAGLIRPAFSYVEYGQQVFFQDSSITHGIAVVRSWDMGYAGGTVGDSTDFIHYFPDTLPRNVCLTITDTAAGEYCQTTFCRMVRTDLLGDCTGLVQPSFSESDATANTLDFFNTSTTVGASEVLWEFGDNTSDTSDYPDHTYLWPGRYYVALNHIVFDQQNQQYCRASAERWVAVDGNGATCNNDLFANFGSSSNGQGLWTFNAETITLFAQVGTEVWSFGDESVGFGPFTMHLYNDPSMPHQVCMLTAGVDSLQDTCYAYVCHTIQEAMTGLMELAPGDDLHIWPTPFIDRLFVPLRPNGGSADLLLIDALGRTVRQAHVPPADMVEWPIGPVPSGVYVVRVAQNGAARTALTAHQ
ncbi:MAG: T9SS type A sorting domain-containing protein [Flavobacteriales bacterium]